jgi:hypothetical protein
VSRCENPPLDEFQQSIRDELAARDRGWGVTHLERAISKTRAHAACKDGVERHSLITSAESAALLAYLDDLTSP